MRIVEHDADEPQDMDSFLLQIEQKAYRMALMSVSQHADAIDLLQDSMLKLVVSYAHKPPQEWKPLFYRILQNRIRDWHRHQKVKQLLFFWKANTHPDDTTEEWSSYVGDAKELPDNRLDASQQQDTALKGLAELSEKQRQCFLLRSWEGMSVADTADIMGCSQGSVKTHYSRAVHKLRSVLEDAHDITI
jgi:RNA polymerase sigma-70 factor (ECF subfamily)